MEPDEAREIVRQKIQSLQDQLDDIKKRLDELENTRRTVNRRPDEIGDAIIRLLEKHDLPFTAATIAESLEIDESLVQARLGTLARRCFIRKVEREGKRPVFRAAEAEG